MDIMERHPLIYLQRKNCKNIIKNSAPCVAISSITITMPAILFLVAKKNRLEILSQNLGSAYIKEPFKNIIFEISFSYCPGILCRYYTASIVRHNMPVLSISIASESYSDNYAKQRIFAQFVSLVNFSHLKFAYVKYFLYLCTRKNLIHIKSNNYGKVHL